MSYRLSSKEVKSIRRVEGRVVSFRSISNCRVILEIDGVPEVVDLITETPWVIARDDQITVAGLNDNDSGKFIGFAYINKTKKVKDLGGAVVPSIFGHVPVVIGIFCLLLAVISIWGSFVLVLIFLGTGAILIAFGRGIVMRKRISERVIDVLTK